MRAASAVREIRFHLCHTSPVSAELRSFISRQYTALKKENPALPVLVREARDCPPRAFVRYRTLSLSLLISFFENNGSSSHSQI